MRGELIGGGLIQDGTTGETLEENSWLSPTAGNRITTTEPPGSNSWEPLPGLTLIPLLLPGVQELLFTLPRRLTSNHLMHLKHGMCIYLNHFQSQSSKVSFKFASRFLEMR